MPCRLYIFDLNITERHVIVSYNATDMVDQVDAYPKLKLER